MSNLVKFIKMSSKPLNILAIFALLVTTFYYPTNSPVVEAQAATPVVSSVSGTISNGSVATINGANFGSKTTANPLIWDNFETGANGSTITNQNPVIGSPWSVWTNGAPALYTNTVTRNNSQKSALFDYTGTGYTTFLQTIQNTDKAYFTFWWRVHNTGSQYSANVKPWDVWGSYDGQCPSTYSGFGDPAYNDGHLRANIIDCDSTHTGHWPGSTDNNSWHWGHTRQQDIADQWVRFEVYLEQSTPGQSNGKYKMWVQKPDGGQAIELELNSDNQTTREYNNYWRQWWILGAYMTKDERSPNARGYVYGDDIYFDTTQARVELGDTATWNTNTRREIQVANTWDSSAVSFRVNTGSFTNGQIAYVYVVDSNGNVNANGYPVTISSTSTPPVDTQAPSAPSNLVATATSTQVNLSWTASTDNVGVSQYLVERSTSATTGFVQIADPSTNSYINTGLVIGTTYYYRVRARDLAGNFSTYSNIVGVTVPNIVIPPVDTQAPSAPSNLVATATSTQVNLSWTASTDNVGVSQYLIERSVSTTTSFTQIATTNTNSDINTGLTAGTTYYYRVRARDLAGNFSTYSNIVGATIPNIVAPPSNTGNYSVWCSALLGIVGAAVDSGVYNRIADLNNDQAVNLSDLSLVQQYYKNNNDNYCQARFINTYTNDNYLNINWCAGIIRGLTDRYNSSTDSNNYFSLFDLNNDGSINLSDTAIVAQYNSSNNQVACFAEYSLPLNTVAPSKQVITQLPSVSVPAVDTKLIKKVEASKTELAKLKLLKGRFVQLADGISVYVTTSGKAISIDNNNMIQVLAKQALGISKATLAKLAVSLNYNDLDNDGDQVPNAIEELIGTNPDNKDTDGDGYTDGVEMENYYSPTKNTPKARLDRNLAKRLAGRVLIVVPGGSLFYVNPTTYKLELLKGSTIDQLNNFGLIKEVKGIKIKR